MATNKPAERPKMPTRFDLVAAIGKAVEDFERAVAAATDEPQGNPADNRDPRDE